MWASKELPNLTNLTSNITLPKFSQLRATNRIRKDRMGTETIRLPELHSGKLRKTTHHGYTQTHNLNQYDLYVSLNISTDFLESNRSLERP